MTSNLGRSGPLMLEGWAANVGRVTRNVGRVTAMFWLVTLCDRSCLQKVFWEEFWEM